MLLSYEKLHKMTTREADEDRVQAKQEENHETRSTAKAAIAPGSSWSRLKDPRIVRVSRAFGGKDRHSKVCTLRGLRDRRVRLSVPTAIQLYDLQDRLGLNQPSKVVDWLLNVAKNEIDELPPLPNIPPPGSFGHNLGQPIVAPHHHQSNSELASLLDQTEPSGSNNAWHSDALFRPKPSKEAVDSSEEKESWTRNENSYFSSNNFFSRLDHHSSSSSSLGLMNSSTMPYNSLIRWDPSNLSLSQSGSPGMAAEDFHNFGLVPLPPSVPALPTGSQQVLHVYHQPGGDHVTQPYFPSHIAAASDYSSGGGRQFHLLGTAGKLHPSQNDHQEKQDGENGFHSR